MPGDVYAVASGKGGVGKTTTVVNLGVVLRRANHSVALVDADLGMANLGTILGVEGEYTVHDVLSGEATLEEALVEEAEGFGVLTGSRDLSSYPDADPKGLRDVIAELAESYDVVIVDTGAGISYEDVLPLGLVDGVLLITTPDPAAVGDAAKTAELTALADGAVTGVVVTHASPTTDATHVAAEVGVDLLGVIPHDPVVRESTAAGRPLEAMAPDSPAAAAYRDLAERVLEVEVEHRDRSTPAPAADDDEGAAADGDGDEEAAEPADAVAANPDEGAEEAEAADDDEAAAASADDAEDEAADETEGEAADESDDEDDDADADEDAAFDAEEGTEDEGGEVVDEEELDEYLEQFEDDEPPRKGGFLSRLTRIFR